MKASQHFINLKYENVFNELQTSEPPAGFEQYMQSLSLLSKTGTPTFTCCALSQSPRLQLKDGSGKN